MKLVKFIFVVELLTVALLAFTHFFFFSFDVEFNRNLYLLIPALLFFYLMFIKFILIPMTKFMK
jgi:hypothetical protein